MPVFIAYLERAALTVGLMLTKSWQLAHAISKASLATERWNEVCGSTYSTPLAPQANRADPLITWTR